MTGSRYGAPTHSGGDSWGHPTPRTVRSERGIVRRVLETGIPGAGYLGNSLVRDLDRGNAPALAPCCTHGDTLGAGLVNQADRGYTVATVQRWTGAETKALRLAMRETSRGFAEHLGVEPRTVAKWEQRGTTITLRPDSQGLLDTALRRASEEVRERFGVSVQRRDDSTVRREVRSEALSLAVTTAVARSGLESHVAATDVDGLDLLQLLDRARLLSDQALSTGSMSAGRLDLVEERVSEYIVTYTCTPPLSMLAALTPDLFEVQTLAQQRQPATVQARISEATAVLGLLSADALMKLGEVRRARCWYGTARLAADDTMNVELRARVRAQEAMLPYYYGRVEHSVTIARAAQALAPGSACSAVALAAAAEARALARLGHLEGAEQAMNRAQQLVDALHEPHGDVAFEFNEKRLMFYLSGTLTYLGQHARARRVQDQALDLYRRDPQIVIDPALIQLDQAVGQATVGNVDDACQLAMAVVGQLPAEHRTRIVLTRATDVVQAVPQHRRNLAAVSELRELVAAKDGGGI